MSPATIGKCMKSAGKILGAYSTILLTSGHKMPIFGIGTALIRGKEAIETTLTTAIDVGYRKIDTALDYGNLNFIGDALKKILDGGKVKREDLFIIDKLPFNGLRDVEYFVKKSIAVLQLDYIDMYVVHSPVATKRTDNDMDFFPHENGALKTDHVDLVDMWKGMEEMVSKGYVKSIGLSNFNSEQIQRICDVAVIKPANLQVECHAYLPQNELHAFCDELDISFTAYSPIGTRGFPKFIRDEVGLPYPEPPILLEEEKLKQMAAKHNKTTAQVALRYLVQRGISVIPKSCNPERIKSNFQIFDFSLDDEEMKSIESLENGFRYVRMDYLQGMKEHPEYPFKIPF